MQNMVTEFKNLLADTMRDAQTCDLIYLLRYLLFSMLKQDPQEKRSDLNDYQELIGRLRRKRDAGLRSKDGERKKEKDPMGQAEGYSRIRVPLGEGSSQSNPEITQWQDDLDKLRTDCQKVLDRLFDECLQKVPPIREDIELHLYLAEYSQEAEFYPPFSNLSNHASDHPPSDIIRPTPFLHCCFHLCNQIETDYEDSGFSIKPDIIITFNVAAGDLNCHSGDPSADLECGKPPERDSQLRQALCSGEKSANSFTTPLIGHEMKCQYKYGWGDKGLSIFLHIDESSPIIEVGEPPAKRMKLDLSESTRRTDCRSWVRYYDREGAIQSNGIAFDKDLPCFLVLLFAFQHFDLADWGIITESNSGAELAQNSTNPDMNSHAAQALNYARLEQETESKTCISETKGPDADFPENLASKSIDIDLNDWLSYEPHCLGGRATAVLCASNPEDAAQSNQAYKFFPSKISRKREGKIVGGLHQENQGDSKKKHLMEFGQVYGDMSRYSGPVRSMLQISIRGYRTSKVLVSRKVAPLTSLAGAEFVRAWLEVVKCHAFLWSCNIEYGDPSLSNVMYNEVLKCGVLCDYDFSISRCQACIPGTDRKGTIPFMALELLGGMYWEGKIERRYGHELEAFIWMLSFVFLRYQDGKPRRGTPVDRWMSSRCETCDREKYFFWWPGGLRSQGLKECQADFKDHWISAQHLLLWASIHSHRIESARYSSFETLDETSASETDNTFEDANNLTSLWPLFVKALKAPRFSSSIGYLEGLINDLELERSF